jgi:cathepsin L
MNRLVLVASGLVGAHADRFDDFKERFGRHYATQYEHDYRLKVFNENMALIDAENAKNKSYTLGITNFADLTSAEFRSQYLTGFVPKVKLASSPVFQAPAKFLEPDSVDWSTKGAVTPIKNQGQCGSCWSFSTTGALEGASFIAGRGLTSLSEQNILDCDKGGDKCEGGSMDQAFEWVAENGICSEADDSYKCSSETSDECDNSQCPTNCTKVLEKGDVTTYTDVEQSEGALEAAVAQQPVSVAIEADETVFQYYTGGILTSEACGENLDHGVLVVGYGTDNGQKYWKVKNSWGTSFGEAGYIRLEKGSTQTGGECGIRKMASYPTVKAEAEVIV